MNSPKNEVQLMDYLMVIWKRKWLIIITTLLIVLFAGTVSFVLPHVWEVDIIIQPSKFFYQSEQGQFEEVLVANPIQIVGEINQESFNSVISTDLNLDIRKFPSLKAENLRDTKLVRVTIREEDTEKAKSILRSLFNHLKKELDKKIDVEIQSIDTQITTKNNSVKDFENESKIKDNEIQKKNNETKIKDLNIQSKEIEKDRSKKEIEASQAKLKISEQRVKNIMEEMKSVKGRIDELDDRLKTVIAEKKQGSDAISLLLYSNEVQQNLRYYNTLDEKLGIEQITQENLRFDIHDKEETIRQFDTQIKQDMVEKNIIAVEISTIKNEIEKIKNKINTFQSEAKLLEEKKMRIDYTRLIKEPTASLYPVQPKRAIIVVISAVLGLTILINLAFFLEYIEKNKKRMM